MIRAKKRLQIFNFYYGFFKLIIETQINLNFKYLIYDLL